MITATFLKFMVVGTAITVFVALVTFVIKLQRSQHVNDRK